MTDYRQLLAYSDAELARIDPLVMNLLVAKSIPSLADLDVPRYQRLADQWAEDVRRRLPGAERVFWRTPQDWKSDVNFFRLGVLCGYPRAEPLGFNAGDTNLYRYVGNHPTDATDPTGESESFWSDYWHYLTHPGDQDTDIKIGQGVAVGTAGVCLTAAGGLALVGVNPILWGGAATAGGAALGVGTTAVVGPGLGAGTYPALLINGVVYVHRFHVLALELAGGAAASGAVQKYGMVTIDAAGKVIGWVGQ